MNIEWPANVGSVNIDSIQEMQNAINKLNTIVENMIYDAPDANQKCCSDCSC